MSELKESCAFGQLLRIMATLRAPGGCPWDAAQTPESLKRYLLEETYETLEAIDSGEESAICEELGDVLLQVVFQARIFEERALFGMKDVVTGIAEKLIRRHPHVFGTSQRGDDDLDAQWDQIKAEEKRNQGKSQSVLDDTPATLPALLRARKTLEKASRLGIEVMGGGMKQTQEHLLRFEKSLARGEKSGIEESLGKLLFSLVGTALEAQVDAEESLRRFVYKIVTPNPSSNSPNSASE